MHRDINFFSAYSSSQYNDSKSIEPISLIGTITVCVCVVAILALFGALKLFDLSQSIQINKINSYLSNTNTVSAQNTVSAVGNKINAANNYANAVSGAYSAFQTLPEPDSSLINSISKAMPADITVENVTYLSNVINLKCTCTNQQSPEIFVHALKTNGKFYNIIFNGYAVSDKNVYSFDVTFNEKGASSK